MNQFLSKIKEHAHNLDDEQTKWYLINMADEYEWMYEQLMELKDTYADITMKLRDFEFDEWKKQRDELFSRTKEIIERYENGIEPLPEGE